MTKMHLCDGHVAASSEVRELRAALELSLREAREIATIRLLDLLVIDQPVEHCATHSDALRLQREVRDVRDTVRGCKGL